MPAFSRLGSLVLLPLMLIGLLGVTMISTPEADAATRVTKVRRAVDIAHNQKGDPYRYGAAGPNAFDCSGLIYFSYRKAGFVKMPRTSGAQSNFGRKIAKRNMRRGDLMFFYGGGGVYHAGIFWGRTATGRAIMWDAPRSGERVGKTVAWTTQWFGRTLRR